MNETTNKPKYLAPCTCPRCGSPHPRECPGIKVDGSWASRQYQCDDCQQRWVQWHKVPCIIEIDGVRYRMEKEPANPGLQAALNAYLRLRRTCERTEKALLAHSEAEELIPRFLQLQLKVLREDLLWDMEAAERSVDGYVDAAETKSLNKIVQDVGG